MPLQIIDIVKYIAIIERIKERFKIIALSMPDFTAINSHLKRLQ